MGEADCYDKGRHRINAPGKSAKRKVRRRWNLKMWEWVRLGWCYGMGPERSLNTQNDYRCFLKFRPQHADHIIRSDDPSQLVMLIYHRKRLQIVLIE
jgi:hypothetical protein